MIFHSTILFFLITVPIIVRSSDSSPFSLPSSGPPVSSSAGPQSTQPIKSKNCKRKTSNPKDKARIKDVLTKADKKITAASLRAQKIQNNPLALKKLNSLGKIAKQDALAKAGSGSDSSSSSSNSHKTYTHISLSSEEKLVNSDHSSSKTTPKKKQTVKNQTLLFRHTRVNFQAKTKASQQSASKSQSSGEDKSAIKRVENHASRSTNLTFQEDNIFRTNTKVNTKPDGTEQEKMSRLAHRRKLRFTEEESSHSRSQSRSD